MALRFVTQHNRMWVNPLTNPVTFHSRHHRLYVPYAYGALYNHPVEGFLLDTLGGGLGYLITGMTVRQSLWFFTGSTIKTVLDHSGYKFPYDPLHFIFPNNAAYHDIHHQSWGIKKNFSQPFFIFWDRIGGTMWQGDVKEKYERSRRIAEEKFAQETENKTKVPTAESTAFPAFEADENVRPQSVSTPRSTRKKASSISQSPAGNLKGLRNKVNDSLHSRRANVLGVESSH
jgi:sphinganine C4-monooxygenase